MPARWAGYLEKAAELVIPPLTAEDVPVEAEALRDELAAMFPVRR